MLLNLLRIYCSRYSEPFFIKDYELAMKRVRTLLELDYGAESERKGFNSSTDVVWAVFEAFSK